MTEQVVDGPAPSPAFMIMTMGRRLRAEIERDLAGPGLTLRHLSALGHLGREPGLSYSELARRAGVTVQSMQAPTRAPARLIERVIPLFPPQASDCGPITIWPSVRPRSARVRVSCTVVEEIIAGYASTAVPVFDPCSPNSGSTR